MFYLLGFFVTVLVMIRLISIQDKIEVKEFDVTSWVAVFMAGGLWMFVVVFLLPIVLFKKVLVPSLNCLSYDLWKKEKDIPFGTHAQVVADRANITVRRNRGMHTYEPYTYMPPPSNPDAITAQEIRNPSINKNSFFILAISDGKISKTWDENTEKRS